MKKIYSSPVSVVLDLCVEDQILTGSIGDGSEITLDENSVDTQLSEHKNMWDRTNFWD